MAYDFSTLEQKLTDAKQWLAKEYQGLRTGRATPAILDSVSVQAYGSNMPLKQVANVGVEDARTLRITAWDQGLVKDIERGITAANLGLGVVADGAGIRVMFPELTAERREQLVKAAKAKLEESRAAVRVARDECWKDIQAKEEEGGMGEDEKFRLKDDLQKKIDTTNADLEKSFDKKEEEMNS
jgi:ribosome recycling factor